MQTSRIFGTVSVALVSLAALVSACSSSSSGDGSTGAGGSGASGGGGDALANCNAARACCVGLSGSAETACVKQANDAEFGMNAAADCAAALAKYKPGGTCVTGGGAGGSGGGSSAGGAGGNVAQPQSAACMRYVSCQATANPPTASIYEMSFGPNATCWASASAAKDCDAQCKSGLATLHDGFPKACVVCLADADCSGATSKCDTAMGKCVAP